MSGQLEKWGIGLSLRLRGEKPIEPCRGRCSFGAGHSSDSVVSRRVRRGAAFCSRHRDDACDPTRIGPAFPGSVNGLPGVVWSARWAVPMEGAYITLLRSEASPPQKKFVAGDLRNRGLANKRPRFRLQRLERLDWNRLDDRFVLFLLVLEFVRVCERPPKRFHARIVVFVTHGRAFAARYSTSIQNGSPFPPPHPAIERDATLARFPLYRR